MADNLSKRTTASETSGIVSQNQLDEDPVCLSITPTLRLRQIYAKAS